MKGDRDTADIHLGLKIKEGREALKMSQESVARYLHITIEQLHEYELGVSPVGPSRLLDISVLLGIPMNSLVGFWRDRRPIDASEIAPVKRVDERRAPKDRKFDSQQIYELEEAFCKIENARLRAKILALVKSLSSDRSNESHAENVVELFARKK